MSEFFRGWRRKIGVITLVMACVFMGGWVRSLFFGDEFILPNSTRMTLSIVSTGGSLGFQKVDALILSRVIPSPYFWSFETGASRELESIWKEAGVEFISVANSCGYRNFRAKWISPAGWKGPPFDYDIHYCAIPYWSITVPLTFISLWLLLTNPRKSPPKKMTGPVPTEGK